MSDIRSENKDSETATFLTLRDEIAERYESIKSRIAAACARAGRHPDEIVLVAVSKTFPDTFIKALYECGHRDFGENKAQELTSKVSSFEGLDEYHDISWHMIGHLQRNKARDVVRNASLFHALDSARLGKELNRKAEYFDVSLPCLVQVNISREESKYGIPPDELHDFLRELEKLPKLSIRGLMAMARQVDNPELVRPDFQLLRNLMLSYRSTRRSNIDLSHLSCGMSQDFEVAIEEGATHIRVGSAIFGPRACMLQ